MVEKKSDEIKNLKKKLLVKNENGAQILSSDELKKVETFSVDYKKFLDECKTERETVTFALKTAELLEFTEFDKNKKYNPGDKVYLLNSNKAAIFAIIGKNGAKNGVKMSVAHLDCPRIYLKPKPLRESHELAFFKTHYYGGIKKYQWTAIPLALHGTAIKNNGELLDIKICENDDDPCFCITDLLPHRAREQMEKKMSKAITGEDLNALIGSLPYKTDMTHEAELVKLNIMDILNKKYGLIEEDLISADFSLVPAFNARDVGFDKSMIGAYGHDDKSCVYSALKALFDTKTIPEKTIITVLCDKEETGSDGNTGMKSLFLKYFIANLAHQEGLHTHDVLTATDCLSSDVNAAVDPTYIAEFELSNSCFLNKGVAISKYTGDGGKYGTSEASAEFTAKILSMLNKNNVLWQACELGKVDSGGGGTIAKYIANLNINVIDIGTPVLSMHAPFEIISKIDLFMVYRTNAVFFASTF
jgi:aspartyl aminopeptidase